MTEPGPPGLPRWLQALLLVAIVGVLLAAVLVASGHSPMQHHP